VFAGFVCRIGRQVGLLTASVSSEAPALTSASASSTTPASAGQRRSELSSAPPREFSQLSPSRAPIRRRHAGVGTRSLRSAPLGDTASPYPRVTSGSLARLSHSFTHTLRSICTGESGARGRARQHRELFPLRLRPPRDTSGKPASPVLHLFKSVLEATGRKPS
jgi:hypothetical protein